jgi:hypothetical protein
MRSQTSESHSRFRSVGGEMDLSLELLFRRGRSELPEFFPDHRTISTGRTGIKLALQAIASSGLGTFLLPSYLCPSILFPFVEMGLKVDFYEVKADLRVDLDRFRALVKRTSPTGILFVNYFGFPLHEDARRTFLEVKDRCWLIEDCCHAFPRSDNGSQGEMGHFVITSFRKYLPLPDGGIVFNRSGLPLPVLSPSTEKFVSQRLLGKLLKAHFLSERDAPDDAERVYLHLFSQAEKEIDSSTPMQGMSVISESLLTHLDLRAAELRRRENFEFMLRAFEDSFHQMGKPLFRELPDSVSPLSFPIVVRPELRNGIRQELIRRGVFCPVHWALPPHVAAERFFASHKLSQSILGIPIDQRYTHTELEGVLGRLRDSWKAVA